MKNKKLSTHKETLAGKALTRGRKIARTAKYGTAIRATYAAAAR